MWTLTYSVEGQRHVEVVPHDQVPLLEPLVERYREYRGALKEIGDINAQLLHLWRQEQRDQRRGEHPQPKKAKKRAKARRR